MLDFSVTFIITIINITILFIVLRKILFKHVTRFIAERTQRIQNSINQAERDKVTSLKMLEEYQNRLKKAEEEADVIVRSAREHAEAEAARIIIQGKAEAEKITDMARAQLENDRLAAVAFFRAEAAALVLSAAGRIVKRELAGPEQQRYAAEILEGLVQDTKNQDMG